MSPMFIKEFRKDNQCRQCHAATRRGRVTCGKHLVRARETWMLWSILRRERGLCSYCTRSAAKPGQIRCPRHAAINRRKCTAWHAVHGKEADERNRVKVNAYLDARRTAGDERSRRAIMAEKGAQRATRRADARARLAAKYPSVLTRAGMTNAPLVLTSFP